MTSVLEPSLLHEYRAGVVDCMCDAALPADTLLAKIIAYHLGLADRDGVAQAPAPGRLIRSTLCLWAAYACGGDAEAALPVAVGIELLHNFTLIHDALQDDRPRPEERETVRAIWGLGQGINAGDALYSLAFCLLVRERSHAERTLQISARATAAVLEAVDAHYRDLQIAGRSQTDLREYLQLALGRTGALLGAALETGALAAGAAERTVRRLGRAGRLCGVALQLRKDLLARDPSEPAPRSRPSNVGKALIASRGEDFARALAGRYANRAAAIVAACGLEREAVGRFEEMAEYLAHRVR